MGLAQTRFCRMSRLRRFGVAGLIAGRVTRVIAVLLIAPQLVSMAAATSQDIDLQYNISWGALSLAEARSQWQLQDGKVVILGTVKSEGVAALFSGFQSASNAEIDWQGGEWRPAFLSLSRVTKSKQIVSSVHWSMTGDILSDVQQPPPDLEEVFPIPDKLKQDVIDPYSATMRQLDYIAGAGKCAGSYAVYDGLRRFEMQFDTVGTTTLVADRPYSFDGEVLHCRIVVMPKGGHRIVSSWHKKPAEDRQVNVYFGRFSDDLILPVRIEIAARLGTGVARLDMTQSQIPGDASQR